MDPMGLKEHEKHIIPRTKNQHAQIPRYKSQEFSSAITKGNEFDDLDRFGFSHVCQGRSTPIISI